MDRLPHVSAPRRGVWIAVFFSSPSIPPWLRNGRISFWCSSTIWGGATSPASAIVTCKRRRLIAWPPKVFVFEQFYVNSPICSPSRTAISTGQYPQRWRIASFLSNRKHNHERGMAQWLDPKAPMLARSLQQAGYATGHFGKWHMGGQRDVDDAPPITRYGFDTSLTNFEGMGPKLLPLTLKPGQQTPGKIWRDAERLANAPPQLSTTIAPILRRMPPTRGKFSKWSPVTNARS